MSYRVFSGIGECLQGSLNIGGCNYFQEIRQATQNPKPKTQILLDTGLSQKHSWEIKKLPKQDSHNLFNLTFD